MDGCRLSCCFLLRPSFPPLACVNPTSGSVPSSETAAGTGSARPPPQKKPHRRVATSESSGFISMSPVEPQPMDISDEPFILNVLYFSRIQSKSLELERSCGSGETWIEMGGKVTGSRKTRTLTLQQQPSSCLAHGSWLLAR